MNLNTESIAVLKKAVQEGVDAKLKEASFKDLLNGIILTTKEKLGGKDCTVDIRGLINKKFDLTYNGDKFQKDKATIEDTYEFIEVIK
jgi:hypothetical protein